MATSKAVIPRLTWDKVRPARVVLVSGTEEFLAERAIRLLRDILRAEDPSLEINDLDASGYAPGELITLASPSLFAEPRMIRVAGVEKCSVPSRRHLPRASARRRRSRQEAAGCGAQRGRRRHRGGLP